MNPRDRGESSKEIFNYVEGVWLRNKHDAGVPPASFCVNGSALAPRRSFESRQTSFPLRKRERRSRPLRLLRVWVLPRSQPTVTRAFQTNSSFREFARTLAECSGARGQSSPRSTASGNAA